MEKRKEVLREIIRALDARTGSEQHPCVQVLEGPNTLTRHSDNTRRREN